MKTLRELENEDQGQYAELCWRLRLCPCVDLECVQLVIDIMLIIESCKDVGSRNTRWQKIKDLFNERGEDLEGMDRIAYYFVMQLLENNEMTDHGGNIGNGWLTQKGEEFLGYYRRLCKIDN